MAGVGSTNGAAEVASAISSTSSPNRLALQTALLKKILDAQHIQASEEQQSLGAQAAGKGQIIDLKV